MGKSMLLGKDANNALFIHERARVSSSHIRCKGLSMSNKLVVRPCEVVVRPGGKKSIYMRGDVTTGGWFCLHVECDKSYWVKTSCERK